MDDKLKNFSEKVLGSNRILGNFYEIISATCTNRPSIPPKGGISRNKVGAPEGVPDTKPLMG